MVNAQGGSHVSRFIKRFRREGAGVWVCIEAAEAQLPHGRVQVSPGMRFTLGTRFMNVELARLLDEQYELDQSNG
jgi:hypothetical protein